MISEFPGNKETLCYLGFDESTLGIVRCIWAQPTRFEKNQYIQYLQSVLVCKILFDSGSSLNATDKVSRFELTPAYRPSPYKSVLGWHHSEVPQREPLSIEMNIVEWLQ